MNTFFLLKLPIYISLALAIISIYFSKNLSLPIYNAFKELPLSSLDMKSLLFSMIGISSLIIYSSTLLLNILNKIFKEKRLKRKVNQGTKLSLFNLVIAYITILNAYILKLDTKILLEHTILICISIVSLHITFCLASDFSNIFQSILTITIFMLSFKTYFRSFNIILILRKLSQYFK